MGKKEYWPGEEWETVPAKEKEKFTGELKSMYEFIDKKRLDYESTIIITQNGRLIEEKYFPGLTDSPTALFSATKSINSLLTGIAIEQGYIPGENERVLDFFPEMSFDNMTNEKQNLSIKNILTMSCGFVWNEKSLDYTNPENIYSRWVNSDNRIKFLLDLEIINTPGDLFNYNTGASHLIPALLQAATGETALDFPRRNLFGPLNIDSRNVIWETDSMGINKGGGLNMRPLDMAKIGHLVLNRGEWENRQVVPEKWINISLSGYFEIGYKRYFGYHWFIYNRTENEIYAAEGYKEQFIFIIPTYESVAVFTGNIVDNENNALYLLYKYIIPALEKQNK